MMFFGEATAKALAMAMDYTSDTVKGLARGIARKFPGAWNIGQICWIWRHFKENFAYVSDPQSGAAIEKASQIIKLGLAGDCDKYSVAIAACIEAVGGSARIALANSLTYEGYFVACHAYPEVFIGHRDYVGAVVLPALRKFYPYLETIHCHVGPGGDFWMNMDIGWDQIGAPLAFLPTTREEAIYPNGRYLRVWLAPEEISDEEFLRGLEDEIIPGVIGRIGRARYRSVALMGTIQRQELSIPNLELPTAEWFQGLQPAQTPVTLIPTIIPGAPPPVITPVPLSPSPPTEATIPVLAPPPQQIVNAPHQVIITPDVPEIVIKRTQQARPIWPILAIVFGLVMLNEWYVSVKPNRGRVSP